jgi:hypothetical protein
MGCPARSWHNFKEILVERFQDMHMNQFKFLELQTVKQQKGKSPLEFADHCHSLCKKDYSGFRGPRFVEILTKRKQNTDF